MALVFRRGTYTPRHQTQRNPVDRWGSVNCAAYAAAMAIDRATMGGLWPMVTGPDVRARSGEPIPEVSSPGLTGQQLQRAARAFRVELEFITPSLDALIAALNGGRGAIVAGLYGAVPSAYRSSASFRGPHAVYANHTDRRLGIAILDPLATAKAYWPLKVVDAYIRGLQGGWILVTRPTPHLAVPLLSRR